MPQKQLKCITSCMIGERYASANLCFCLFLYINFYITTVMEVLKKSLLILLKITDRFKIINNHLSKNRFVKSVYIVKYNN